MPSSRDHVRPLQLEPLTQGTVAVAEVELPTFETIGPAAPTLHSFALAGGATIPPEVLAAATAAARAAGYADGWSKGLDDARAATAAQRAAQDRDAIERANRADRAMAALHQAAADLQHRTVAAAADIQEHIIAAAWEIAAALVGDVLIDDDRRGQVALTRALDLAPTDQDVVVSVNPADFAVLAEGRRPHGTDPSMTSPGRDVIRDQQGLRTVTILPDPSLAPGDATATCGPTTIDARLSSAIERVREVLAP